MPVAHFTIYSRSYCHLCEEMRDALNMLRHRYDFTTEMIDVDADEALTMLYDELVPVLFGKKPEQPAVRLCHHFLDLSRIETFLSGT